jgi:hypothetical protein
LRSGLPGRQKEETFHFSVKYRRFGLAVAAIDRSRDDAKGSEVVSNNDFRPLYRSRPFYRSQQVLAGKVIWNYSNPAAGNPSSCWAMLDGTTTGECVETARLNELVLEQLGISAEWEVLAPSGPDVTTYGIANFQSQGTPFVIPGIPRQPVQGTDGNYYALVYAFNFHGNTSADNGEGGVRVGDRFDGEGVYPLVGVDGGGYTAEYDALVQIANACASLNTFQEAAFIQVTQAGVLVPGGNLTFGPLSLAGPNGPVICTAVQVCTWSNEDPYLAIISPPTD